MRALALALVFVPVVALAQPPKRAMPDYDGRADEAPSAWLWLPRVALSPLYLLSEYGVRRPLGAIVTNVERVQLPQPTFGPSFLGRVEWGVAPSLVLDHASASGARVSLGLILYADHLLADAHTLGLRVTYGTHGWIELDVDNRVHLDDHRLSLAVGFHARDDAVFGDARYGVARFGVALADRLTLPHGHLDAALELRNTQYTHVPELDHAHLQLVPSAGVSYDDVLHAALTVAAPIALTGDSADTLEVTSELGVVVDVYRRRRIGLRLHASVAAPLDDGPLLRASTSRLGGEQPMRGFEEGELVGESALVAIVEYRWPVWVWLDGQLFAELGNAFGRHFEGLDADQLRVSFGIGMRAPEDEPGTFELLLAAGTDTLGDGLGLTHVRVVFGTTSGF